MSQQSLALTLTGGGARAAYQVGVLSYLASQYPQLHFDVLNGVSAGAINAVYLAERAASQAEAAQQLANWWQAVELEQIFKADLFHMARNFTTWSLRLLSGGNRMLPPMRGMVDTNPLRQTLLQAFESERGEFPAVAARIDAGELQALSISTTDYGTGESVTWVQAQHHQPWVRRQRHSRSAQINLEHVLASAALPMLFPAVDLGGAWHGDGGMRLIAPLSPALHLGAERILAISTRHLAIEDGPPESYIRHYPPPAQVIGVLLNAVFLDALDYDAANMRRFNEMYAAIAPAERQRLGLRKAEVLVLRPSRDLGRLAGTIEKHLPRALRFFTRGFGTRETASPDALSMLLFVPEYIRALIDLGAADAAAQQQALADFLQV